MENEELRVYTPSEDAFKLTKVKMTKEGGLDVHYEETEKIGQQTYVTKKHIECGKDVHPDLRKAFKALRSIVVSVFNMDMFLRTIFKDEFNATEEQKDMARELQQNAIESCISISGVSISGEDENVGYIIMSKIETAGLQVAAVNTPRIKLSEELYGIEDKLAVFVDDIESEVYAYLFKGKKAQGELFGANGEPNDAVKNG